MAPDVWPQWHGAETRVKYNAFDTSPFIFYYRHENNAGKAISQNSIAYGITLE
jgi:hypothetical protein